MLRERLRETDVLGRLGGDECGIILPHVKAEQTAVLADGILLVFELTGRVRGPRAREEIHQEFTLPGLPARIGRLWRWLWVVLLPEAPSVRLFKIDGDFIRGFGANTIDQLAVQAIVGIAFAQGFHIGEPRSLAEMFAQARARLAHRFVCEVPGIDIRVGRELCGESTAGAQARVGLRVGFSRAAPRSGASCSPSTLRCSR